MQTPEHDSSANAKLDTQEGLKTVPRPGDETFDHNGKVVLVLDQQISQLLGNKTVDLMTVDLMTDDDGSHLILEN